MSPWRPHSTILHFDWSWFFYNTLYLLHLTFSNTSKCSAISNAKCCHHLLPRAFSVTYWSSEGSTVDSRLEIWPHLLLMKLLSPFLAIQPWNRAASLPRRFEIHPCPFVTSCDSVSTSVAGTNSRPLGRRSHSHSLYSPNFNGSVYDMTNCPWLK